MIKSAPCFYGQICLSRGSLTHCMCPYTELYSLLSNEVTMVLNGGECTWMHICTVLILKIDQKKILHLVVRSIIDRGADFISTPNIRLMNFYFVTRPSSE